MTAPAAHRLAAALVEGARAELDLTPKPGLVDRRDNGSHPDLSFETMSRSIDLLPLYFDDLLRLAEREADAPPLDLQACVDAGRRAEARMTAAIGTNAHRGYIFLAGLTLLAAATAPRASLRASLADLAARVLVAPRPDAAPVSPSRSPRTLSALSPRPSPRPAAAATHAALTHGADIRRRLGIGGIHAEALAGLPSVFDHGLPALERARAAAFTPERAGHYLMAALMTSVEDTTALHRCGREGLERLRDDGRRLMGLIEEGADYLAQLAALNDEYRAINLTMGGVADCMAVTLALWAARLRASEAQPN